MRPKDLVATLGHVLDHVSRAVDAGDLVLVLLSEGHQVILGHAVEGGEGGVDEDVVGGGNLVQHGLEGVQISEGLAAGKDEVTLGGDAVHGADALADFLQAEAHGILILLLVDAEGAVVAAVIRHENRDGCAALAGFVWILGHKKCLPFDSYFFHVEIEMIHKRAPESSPAIRPGVPKYALVEF